MLVKTEIIVLKSMKYRDTSKILTVYSKEFGKIKCIAKGARTAKNKFGMALEPLTHALLVFYKKEHHELHLVSQCDSLTSFKSLQKDYERLMISFALIEFLERITHGEEKHELLFQLILDSLAGLNDLPKTPMLLYHAFRLRCAMLLGYSPQFDACVQCHDTLDAEKGTDGFVFHIARGALFCKKCLSPDGTSHGHPSSEKVMVTISAPTLQILRKCTAPSFSVLKNIVVDQKTGNEIEELLRLYLQYHFEYVTNMKSLEVMHATLH